MIPTDRLDVFDAGCSLLKDFGTKTNVRGRFVSLYLGLRRMGSQLAPLGSKTATPAAKIERFLDLLYTKTHRPEPLVVLTALFGGSTSPSAGYSARTGVIAPGNQYPTNNWRNNFNIQKGIGCPADPDTIGRLLTNPEIRHACQHMAVDPEGRETCGLAGAAYRGDEHSIWLRIVQNQGYQVVDLDNRNVYANYLQPLGERIPIFPLMAALYGFAPREAYPQRATVGIPDFAEDFGFTLNQVEELFDCNPDSQANAAILAISQGQIPSVAVLPPAEDQMGDPSIPVLGTIMAMNTGVGAEIAVAKELVKHEWTVVYRGNQRGYGYDIEASREGQTLRVEVKSSVGFTVPELTEAEWQAAQNHGDDFVLAVVDFYGSDKQRIWYLRNPAANAIPAERTTIMYRLARDDIQSLGTDAEFL